MDSQLGQVLLRRYLVDRLVGSGILGSVYEGRDYAIDRRVAIRLIDAECASSCRGDEAKTAGQLSELHLTETLDVDRLPSGQLCIVSEFLEGETLQEKLRRYGRMSEVGVVQLLTQLLQGIAAAHVAGVVHRDLTPRSIFVVTTGSDRGDVVKLLDFGISRFNPALPEHRRAAAMADWNTWQYLSPEQLSGLTEPTVRSNVYTLGVIAYEAITGQLPFEGGDLASLKSSVLLEDPKPLEAAIPAISPELAQWIRRAMARSPNARFKSAAEMFAAITGSELVVHAPASRSTPPLPPDLPGAPATGLDASQSPGGVVTEGSLAASRAPSEATSSFTRAALASNPAMPPQSEDIASQSEDIASQSEELAPRSAEIAPAPPPPPPVDDVFDENEGPVAAAGAAADTSSPRSAELAPPSAELAPRSAEIAPARPGEVSLPETSNVEARRSSFRPRMATQPGIHPEDAQTFEAPPQAAALALDSTSAPLTSTEPNSAGSLAETAALLPEPSRDEAPMKAKSAVKAVPSVPPSTPSTALPQMDVPPVSSWRVPKAEAPRQGQSSVRPAAGNRAALASVEAAAGDASDLDASVPRSSRKRILLAMLLLGLAVAGIVFVWIPGQSGAVAPSPTTAEHAASPAPLPTVETAARIVPPAETEPERPSEVAAASSASANQPLIAPPKTKAQQVSRTAPSTPKVAPLTSAPSKKPVTKKRDVNKDPYNYR